MLKHDSDLSLHEALERAKERIGDIDNEDRINNIVERITKRINEDIPISERRFVCYWDSAFVDGENVRIEHFKDFVYGVGYSVDNLITIGSLKRADTAFFWENPMSCVGVHIILRVH